MCLGVPGQVLDLEKDELGLTMGRVRFGGITKKVCLAYTPEAAVGDFVVVHVGFALSKIDEAEAKQVFTFLEEMGELGELSAAEPEAPS